MALSARGSVKGPLSVETYASMACVSDEELMLALCAKIDDYNKQLNIPKTLKEFGINEAEFKEKLPEIAKNAVGDACTGSNPRSITPDQMAKLFTAIYYGEKVDF